MKRIPLHARDGSVRAYALVSDRDFKRAARWIWRLHSEGYAYRGEWIDGKYRTILLHRAILGLEPDDPRQGDHEDRDKLNCQRSNLRIAERGALDNGQNRSAYGNNTSGYRGVSWFKPKLKWRARVELDGREYHLGYHSDVIDAARAAEAFRRAHMPFAETDLTLDPVPPCGCRMCR